MADTEQSPIPVCLVEMLHLISSEGQRTGMGIPQHAARDKSHIPFMPKNTANLRKKWFPVSELDQICILVLARQFESIQAHKV